MSILNRAGVLTLAVFTTLAWVWCLTTYDDLLSRQNVVSLAALVSLFVILIIDSGSRFARTMHVLIFGISLIGFVWYISAATFVLATMVGLVLATLLATFHDVLKARLSQNVSQAQAEKSVKHVPEWDDLRQHRPGGLEMLSIMMDEKPVS